MDCDVRRGHRLAAPRGSVCLALALLGHTALAPGEESSASAEPTSSLEQVIVTGSLIPTAPDDRTTPLTVVDQDALNRGGNDSLGSALQRLPSNTGAPANTNINNGGDGSVRVDLRGIGPQRTLVLLNGRRFPNGGVGGDFSVDLNMLPLSMIARVEVTTSGASAVYGADAVAGVVNVITYSGYRGFEMTAQQSESTRGDGTIRRASMIYGHDVGAGNWMLGLDYVKQDGVLASARAFSAVPLTLAPDGSRVFNGSLTTPDGRFDVPAGNALGLPPGTYTRVPGATGQTASDYRLATSEDAFNYRPYSYLQTPNERGSAWLIGSQPIGKVTVFAEGLYDVRSSSQVLAPAPYSVEPGFAPLNADGEPVIPAHNYYNPFGLDLTNVQRRLMELSNRGFSQDITLWRGLLGVRGEAGGWNWEVSGAWAQSRARTEETGQPTSARLLPAVGPSGLDAGGNLVCGAPDPATGIVPAGNIVSGCVPLNLFGGAGTISAPAAAYINVPLTDHGANEQRFVDLAANREWGQARGRPVYWALGAEWRDESGDYQLDPLRLSGTAGGGLQSDIPAQTQKTRELYAEARIPLTAVAADAAGGADLVLGGRLSDISSFGTHPSWHAGFHWQTLPAVALRADYSEVFRAPSLSELYAAPVNAPIPATDPCGNQPNAAVRANCAAAGVPGGSYVQTGDINVLAGGNSALTPERGSSFDAGIDLRSRESPLSASIDFYRLHFSGFILNNADVNQVLFECAVHGAAWACPLVHRLPDGTVDYVDTRNQNFGDALVQGLDFQTGANFATRGGQLHFDLAAAYLQKHDLTTDGMVLHYAGNFPGRALPHWRGLGRATWELGSWRLGYAAQLIGSFSECTLDDPAYCHRVSSVLYHDVDVTYRIGGRSGVIFGVNNLTDVQPPFLGTGFDDNTDPATYRLLGRTWYAQVVVGL
jgi:outer membrane cobalamin receptor